MCLRVRVATKRCGQPPATLSSLQKSQRQDATGPSSCSPYRCIKTRTVHAIPNDFPQPADRRRNLRMLRFPHHKCTQAKTVRAVLSDLPKPADRRKNRSKFIHLPHDQYILHYKAISEYIKMNTSRCDTSTQVSKTCIRKQNTYERRQNVQEEAEGTCTSANVFSR